MGQTAVIKDPRGNIVTVKIHGREAQSFRIGQSIQIPDKASTPTNWPWPDMPVSVDRDGKNVLEGYTCEVTDDPPPAPPPPPAPEPTRDERLAGMLANHGLTLADLKAALARSA